METVDTAVIGAGVVGLAAARDIARRGHSVCVLDQEFRPGTGTSTRNSQVIHAGIYYPAGSLKAKHCIAGARMLYEFCAAYDVPFKRCGKLIVVHSDEEVAALETLRLPLLTSLAVLTELFYLLGHRQREAAFAWRYLRSGGISVLPISDADLAGVEALMRQYHARPMDFADATLVHLARRESISTVLTIDHDDFETYRIEGRRRFRIVPGR